ncbi:hypothetical protein ACET3Z_013740 [Daucus carota]
MEPEKRNLSNRPVQKAPAYSRLFIFDFRNWIFMEKSKDSACGPIDRSLLFMQEDHISTSIWEGDDRLRFDVRQYTTCMDKWVLDDEQRHLLDSWGFGVFAHPQQYWLTQWEDLRLEKGPV